MYSVLIADDNSDWLDILAAAVGSEAEFNVIATAQDGQRAMELIEELRPDVILLDIIMPKVDGVQIVTQIKSTLSPYAPLIYILSGIGTDSVIKILNDLNIAFYSMKPIKLDIVIENLHKLVQNQPSKRQPDNKDQKIFDALYQFGLRPYSRKTDYIKDALMFYLDTPDASHPLTKVIYPEIAKKHGVTATSVERSIRYAITQLQNNKTDLYKSVFSYSSSYSITNSEFLSFAANYIRNNVLQSTR